MKRILYEHWTELLIGVASLLTSFFVLPLLGVSQDVQWIIGSISSLLTISTILIKIHLTNEILRNFERYGLVGEINNILAELDGRKLQVAWQELEGISNHIKRIQHGIIHLGTSAYFHAIITRIKESGTKSEVYAISCIDPKWDHFIIVMKTMVIPR